MEFLIHTEDAEEITLFAENSLEEKVEAEVERDDWVQKLLDDLEERTDWRSASETNYAARHLDTESSSYVVEDYAPPGQNYFNYDSFEESLSEDNTSYKNHALKAERETWNTAQEVLRKTKEKQNVGATYSPSQAENDAKNEIKVFAPGFWVLAYNLSGGGIEFF